jgi:hypothetical protein
MPAGSKPGERRGGRQKGTPNKITSNVRELLDKLECNPLEGLARIANDENNPIEIRTRAYSELAQYVSPKLRAMELTGAGGGAIEVNVSAIELFKSRVSRIAEQKRAG